MAWIIKQQDENDRTLYYHRDHQWRLKPAGAIRFEGKADAEAVAHEFLPMEAEAVEVN